MGNYVFRFIENGHAIITWIKSQGNFENKSPWQIFDIQRKSSKSAKLYKHLILTSFSIKRLTRIELLQKLCTTSVYIPWYYEVISKHFSSVLFSLLVILKSRLFNLNYHINRTLRAVFILFHRMELEFYLKILTWHSTRSS